MIFLQKDPPRILIQGRTFIRIPCISLQDVYSKQDLYYRLYSLHCETFWFRLVKVSKKVHGFDILLEIFYLPLVNVFKVL